MEGELSPGNGPINDTFKKTIKTVKKSAAMPFINFLFKVFDEKLKLSSSFMFELGSIASAKSLNLLIKNKRMILKTNLPVVKREITSQTLVEDLSISSALKSRLISNGYITVFDIQKGSIDGLKVKGFGPKRISEIEKELSSFLN